MTALARLLCSRYHAVPPTVTLTQVNNYLAVGKITQAEYDCIVNPECDCNWSSAAAVAEVQAE